jgi:hypothetical protein
MAEPLYEVQVFTGGEAYAAYADEAVHWHFDGPWFHLTGPVFEGQQTMYSFYAPTEVRIMAASEGDGRRSDE